LLPRTRTQIPEEESVNGENHYFILCPIWAIAPDPIKRLWLGQAERTKETFKGRKGKNKTAHVEKQGLILHMYICKVCIR
jgi:hypothetical protein